MGGGDVVMDSVEPVVVSSGMETQPNSNNDDLRFYSYNEQDLKTLQEAKPWMNNPKHFQNVAISPSAIMKMMQHCASGVEKGIAKGGNPIEVMGLLLGRPDTSNCSSTSSTSTDAKGGSGKQKGKAKTGSVANSSNSKPTLVVTDAFPLPIEGFETRVIADDEAVVNHMISLNECLEMSRSEKFMGWYHSHPFDVGDHSHCFLSQTDLSTQLQWQRAEDPHGNPFVAIVVDPLRSLHLSRPELKAFRAFPPEYESPTPHQCPDGSIQPLEKLRLEHWGSCWNRYYELPCSYYMSTTSRHVMERLTSNYLWMTTLKSHQGNSNTAAAATAGDGNQDVNETTSMLQQIATTTSSSRSSPMAPTASHVAGHLHAPESSSTGGPLVGAASVTPGGSSGKTTTTPPLDILGNPTTGSDTAALSQQLQCVATAELTQTTFLQIQQQVFAMHKNCSCCRRKK